MHALPRGLGHGAQERTDAPLAVGSRHMNNRRQPALGVLQLFQQREQPIQAEIDQPRMQTMQPRDSGSVLVTPGASVSPWCVPQPEPPVT